MKRKKRRKISDFKIKVEKFSFFCKSAKVSILSRKKNEYTVMTDEHDSR